MGPMRPPAGRLSEDRVVVASATEFCSDFSALSDTVVPVLWATNVSTSSEQGGNGDGRGTHVVNQAHDAIWLIIEIGDVPEQPHSEGSLEDRRRIVGICFHRFDVGSQLCASGQRTGTPVCSTDRWI